MRRASIAAGLAVVFIGACGSSQGATDAPMSLRVVATHTKSAGTARYTLRVANDDRGEGVPAQVERGVFDFVHHDGNLEQRPVELSPGQQAMSAIVVAGVVYMPMTDVGPIDRKDPCYGKHWGSFDYPKYSKQFGINAANGASPLPFDPSRALASLERSDAKLTRVGAETVRGLMTMHYSVAVDPAHIDPWFMRDGHDNATLTAFDVWVDHSQQLVRARWVLAIPWTAPALAGTPTRGTYHEATTIDLSDYGVPVHVDAPAASDTCDFPEFFARSMATFD